MNRVILTLIAVIIGVMPAPSHAGSHVRSEPYSAGLVGDSDGMCAEDRLNPTGLNLGVVCIPAARNAATIRIEDVSMQTIAGFYIYVDASGQPIGDAISFCGQTTAAFRPAGGATLVVYIGGPALGPLTCLLDGPGDSPGIGTQGSVTATFRF